MYIYFLIIFLILIIVIYFLKNKVKIKVSTFFKKGFKVNRGIFGIYCYNGLQGSGKSYSCVEYIIDNYSNLQIFSNIEISVINYIKFEGFSEMLKLRDAIDYSKSCNYEYIIFNGKKYPIDFEKQILFVYDEIFSELQKGARLSNDVLDFITQMRKRKFILLTTSQIWSDIPLTWRRLTRYQIDCKMKSFIGINILIKTFYDAENMKWSNDDQEFIAPLLSTTITHTRKFIADSYDTFQVIHNKNHISPNYFLNSSLHKTDLKEKNLNSLSQEKANEKE